MASSTLEGHGRLKGQVAIVTGGASPQGFGYAIAARFLSEGCNVLLCDINPALLASSKQLESITTAQVAAMDKMDVTTKTAWETAVKLCFAKWGKLTIVVNNAGATYSSKPSLKVTEDEFDRVMSVNVKSVYHSVNASVPAIRQSGHGGSIINISSTGAIRPRPGLAWYNASKAAVSNATKALAAEFGGDGIRVNAICPLLSATSLFKDFVGVDATHQNMAKFAETIPLGRLTEPIDVANAAVFLASDEGKFVTGTDFKVDGGRCI